MIKVKIRLVTLQHQDEFFKAYERVYSSREEVQTFYGRFLENGWVSGAWKNRELVGVLTWEPKEAAKSGLAEIVDIWVRAEERRKGIGGKLLDNALVQMQQYYQRFGATLKKVMLFTGDSDTFLSARTLYEKKGFRVVAIVPRNALANPDCNVLLYVLRIVSSLLKM